MPDYTHDIVTTVSQKEYLNTIFGTADNQGSGKYIENSNGFYGDVRAMWDRLNEYESVRSVGGVDPGLYDYGWDGAGLVPLNGDRTMEPNSQNNGYLGDQRVFNSDIASRVANFWEGRTGENATINGTTRTKDAWSVLLARWVFEDLVTLTLDDKLDWSNGTAIYRTNSTWGTNRRYPLDFESISWVDGSPNYMTYTYLKRMNLQYSAIYSQIQDDPVYAEASESGGGTKELMVEEWLTNGVNYALIHSEILVDGQYIGGWKNQTGLTPNYDVGYTFTNGQTHVWFDSGNVGHNKVTTVQSACFNNRHWGALGLIATAGNLFNNSTWKAHTKAAYELFFKLQVFPDNSFCEWYRSYMPGGYNIGWNYWIVTGWELVDFAFQHAVAVTNGVTGLTDAGYYFNYTTSLGDVEVFSATGGWTAGDTTSGGNKGLYNLLMEQAKYMKEPYLSTRFAEGGTQSLDPTDYKYGQIFKLANTWYQTTELGLAGDLSTAAGYPGQGYSGDGNGTLATPNFHSTWGGAFGNYGPMVMYGDNTNIFDEYIAPIIKKLRRKIIKLIYN